MKPKHVVAPDLGSGLIWTKRPVIAQAAVTQITLFLASAGPLSSQRMEVVPCDLSA